MIIFLSILFFIISSIGMAMDPEQANYSDPTLRAYMALCSNENNTTQKENEQVPGISQYTPIATPTLLPRILTHGSVSSGPGTPKSSGSTPGSRNSTTGSGPFGPVTPRMLLSRLSAQVQSGLVTQMAGTSGTHPYENPGAGTSGNHVHEHDGTVTSGTQAYEHNGARISGNHSLEHTGTGTGISGTHSYEINGAGTSGTHAYEPIGTGIGTSGTHASEYTGTGASGTHAYEHTGAGTSGTHAYGNNEAGTSGKHAYGYTGAGTSGTHAYGNNEAGTSGTHAYGHNGARTSGKQKIVDIPMVDLPAPTMVTPQLTPQMVPFELTQRIEAVIADFKMHRAIGWIRVNEINMMNPQLDPRIKNTLIAVANGLETAILAIKISFLPFPIGPKFNPGFEGTEPKECAGFCKAIACDLVQRGPILGLLLTYIDIVAMRLGINRDVEYQVTAANLASIKTLLMGLQKNLDLSPRLVNLDLYISFYQSIVALLENTESDKLLTLQDSKKLPKVVQRLHSYLIKMVQSFNGYILYAINNGYEQMLREFC